ncbi:hypothetical protein Ssi03_08600 [Sphaerisporangium siamense]|uniref:Uncharacterized protein n=1 Tax=Sphaerisporangium siamense TaxID=795645 RepID=A0A7W7GE67_9ACTN|nr:hypothetical protein [Sphaerisporangium siamense]MBB4705745.1 hypothetical protein [Sphaerisporangium siamense]GII82870.1 hypothetical protein Ssi03_08600 [Sphaerisporangium siamense]
MELSRNFWLNAPRGGIFTINNWGNMHRRSFVVVVACEARNGDTGNPDRFQGDAWPVVVGCIAPNEGFLQFTLWWYGNFPRLNIFTDAFLFA